MALGRRNRGTVSPGGEGPHPQPQPGARRCEAFVELALAQPALPERAAGHAGEHLRYVEHPDRMRFAREPSRDVHQAAQIASEQHPGAGGQNVGAFLVDEAGDEQPDPRATGRAVGRLPGSVGHDGGSAAGCRPILSEPVKNAAAASVSGSGHFRSTCRMQNEMLSLAGCSGLQHGVYRTKMPE